MREDSFVVTHDWDGDIQGLINDTIFPSKCLIVVDIFQANELLQNKA